MILIFVTNQTSKQLMQKVFKCVLPDKVKTKCVLGNIF